MMRSAGISVALAVAAVCCGIAATDAPGATPSGVTIHVKDIQQGSGVTHRLYGYVFSQRPKKCANVRSVGVFRQRGKNPDPRTDARIDYYQTHKVGGRAKWRATEPRERIRVGKRYYAWIRKEYGCQGDTSRTIRVRAG
jgi:hypothetical protein